MTAGGRYIVLGPNGYIPQTDLKLFWLGFSGTGNSHLEDASENFCHQPVLSRALVHMTLIRNPEAL